jgi:hypothetical protein
MSDLKPNNRVATRRRVFAAIGLIAGVALLVLEVVRPLSSSSGERWFWLFVGVMLIGVSVAQLREPGGPSRGA